MDGTRIVHGTTGITCVEVSELKQYVYLAMTPLSTYAPPPEHEDRMKRIAITISQNMYTKYIAHDNGVHTSQSNWMHTFSNHDHNTQNEMIPNE